MKRTSTGQSSQQRSKKNMESDILQAETNKMEEKLELVKKMMEMEKEKRSKVSASSQGSMWRGATTKKGIKGYSNAVVQHHKKTQPNLPPTSKVTETRQRIPSGVQRPSNKKLSKEEAKMNFVGTEIKKASMGKLKNISSNIMNAVKYQSDEFAEVREFLDSVKLEKYFDRMIENGIEDMETILELKDEHVQEMGVPLGHKLKMVKRIKELRGQKGLSVSQSQASIQTGQGSSPAKSSKAVSFATQSAGDEKPSPQKVEQKGILKKKEGSEQIIDGEYNEAESHNGFLEALNAWRNQGKPKKDKKKVDLDDIEEAWKRQQDTSAKGSFFANIDTGNTDFHFEAIPTWQEGGTQPDKKWSSKESCWQCFKIYKLDASNSDLKDGTKTFCSKPCLNAFNALNSQACQLSGCQKRFKKVDGAFLHGRWFCSDEHANQDPKSIKMKEIEAKIAEKRAQQAQEEEFVIDL